MLVGCLTARQHRKINLCQVRVPFIIINLKNLSVINVVNGVSRSYKTANIFFFI